MSNPRLDRAATAITALRTEPEFAALEPLEQHLLGRLAEIAPELDGAAVGAAWMILAETVAPLVENGLPTPGLVSVAQLAGQRLYTGAATSLETPCPVVRDSGTRCRFTAKGPTADYVDALMQTHYATYHAGESWPPEVEESAPESATPTIGRCDDCRRAVGITPSEHVLPGFAVGSGRVLCAECALNRSVVTVNDVRAAYGLPPATTPIGPLPESAREYDGIVEALGGAIWGGSANAEERQYDLAEAVAELVNAESAEAPARLEDGLVATDAMRRALGLADSDRGRFAKCALCGDPVFVFDDGSTEGGVDTVVGIRCDRCVVLDAAVELGQPTPQSVREGRHSINELRVHLGLAEVGLPDDEPMPEGLLDALLQATWAEAARAGTLVTDGEAGGTDD